MAEILLNRLLNPASFSFENVSAVVVDEFHSFNDPERGIVWELTLSLLPAHVRLMLLSATVGNASLFLGWLSRCHGRRVALIQDDERRVPLAYEWVPDKLLNEQIEQMAQGSDEERRTPALVFCFNREECWTVAEQLKGLSLLDDARRTKLRAELETYDLTKGVGPKIKQILYRGVGVHHAGMLPKYRRLVEDLYGQKLLSVAVCTETLAAGINLPARSVVLTTLMKGPFGKKKIINASIAHQIFGRAGRPQYDDHGFVYRPGPRGRCPHSALAAEVRFDPRRDQRPRPDEGQEGHAQKAADAAGQPTVLDGTAIPQADRRPVGEPGKPGDLPLASAGLPVTKVT